MSNFMRNFVIEMEIANINLSLLSIPSFILEMGSCKTDYEIAIRKENSEN